MIFIGIYSALYKRDNSFPTLDKMESMLLENKIPYDKEKLENFMIRREKGDMYDIVKSSICYSTTKDGIVTQLRIVKNVKKDDEDDDGVGFEIGGPPLFGEDSDGY